jgi:hypothetical protein
MLPVRVGFLPLFAALVNDDHSVRLEVARAIARQSWLRLRDLRLALVGENHLAAVEVVNATKARLEKVSVRCGPSLQGMVTFAVDRPIAPGSSARIAIGLSDVAPRGILTYRRSDGTWDERARFDYLFVPSRSKRTRVRIAIREDPAGGELNSFTVEREE